MGVESKEGMITDVWRLYMVLKYLEDTGPDFIQPDAIEPGERSGESFKLVYEQHTDFENE